MITSPVAIATLNALPYHLFYSIALVDIHRWVEPQLLSSSTRPFSWSTVPVCNWFIEQCLPKKCYSRQWQLTRIQASCGWALTLQTRTSSQFHTQIHLPATPPWDALVAAQVICLVFLCFILFGWSVGDGVSMNDLHCLYRVLFHLRCCCQFIFKDAS